ncbi:MAG: Ig-like domain-containing protein [Candidatus Sulfotelmatobacter sp.]
MKHELRLISAFATLAILVLAVGCRGFFTNPTLTSIAVSPTAPEVEVNQTLQLQAFGTFDDGSRSQIKSGDSWSSDTPLVASVDSASGVLTGLGLGTATITANAQGLSGTAAATVFLGGVTAITVSPTSGNVSNGTAGSEAEFQAFATTNGTQVDITSTGSTWTITPTSTDLTCSLVGDFEVCTSDSNAAIQTYTLTVGYPGTTIVGTATITVTQ